MEFWQPLNAYCLPKKNTVFERYQFWAHPMAENITVDKYLTELKMKSKDCEFGFSENDMIRDKVVFSLSDQCLKERLLREPNLTLERAVNTCRAAETAMAQMEAMGAARNETAVHILHERKAWDKQTPNKMKLSATYMQSKGPSTICRNCGKLHQPRQCPAYGATCNNCGKQNHNCKNVQDRSDTDTENSARNRHRI